MACPTPVPPTPITAPEICNCDTPEPQEPHEPPMGLDGGSLFFHLNDKIRQDRIAPGDPRPYKHLLTTKAYGPVGFVRVITELNNGKFSFLKYSVPASMGCQLLLFLQQLTETPPTGSAFGFESLGSEPQVLIKGGDFLLETDRQLQGPIETFKSNRRHKYGHPGYQRHFRVGGWRIVNSAFQRVFENNDPANGRPFEAFAQDAFKLYVTFHD